MKRILALTILIASCTATAPQPELGSRSVGIIEKDGLQFKDLNKNGELDIYEDWRQSTDARSKDLISQMTLDEKVGMLLISTTRMQGDYSFQRTPPENPEPL
ncbi:MAG: hypothetical protein RIR51_1503, partial [Bacteroidota bacterium]